MTEKRILALLGLLLGLVGGLLVLLRVLDFGRLGTIDLAWVLGSIVDLILGFILIFGAVLIYRGSYHTGGIVNLIVGILALILADFTGGLLGVLSGILGLLAAETHH